MKSKQEKTFRDILDDIENQRRKKSKQSNIVFNEKIGDKPTFYGVLFDDDIWKEARSPWNDDTCLSYVKKFIGYVFPYLNEKALCDLTKEDFVELRDVIRKRLRREGKEYGDDCLHQYEYRISRITKAAEKKGICTDALWGTSFQISTSTDDTTKSEKEYIRLRKSLSIGEERYIADRILYNPEQVGEYFGLALMFCLGLRDNEACAASFGDVEEIMDDVYALRVYKSGKKNTRQAKYGGKTANANRIIPIPNILKDLLSAREEYIITQDKKLGKRIKELPIACKGMDFKCQCRSSEIGQAGTKLLREASLDEGILMFIDAGLKKVEDEESEDTIVEKDPTAYLFRRNFATHLYLLGLTDTEIQYVMGHYIEDANTLRNFFRNEEKLMRIARKLCMRPIVNEINDETIVVRESHCSLKNVTDAMIVVPTPADSECILRINVQQREPHSDTSIQLDADANGTYYCTPNTNDYAPTTNIIPTYLERYRAKQEYIRKQNKKESF